MTDFIPQWTDAEIVAKLLGIEVIPDEVRLRILKDPYFFHLVKILAQLFRENLRLKDELGADTNELSADKLSFILDSKLITREEWEVAMAKLPIPLRHRDPGDESRDAS